MLTAKLEFYNIRTLTVVITVFAYLYVSCLHGPFISNMHGVLRLFAVTFVTYYYSRWPSVGKLWNYYRLGHYCIHASPKLQRFVIAAHSDRTV
jgi:hypothetical protein